MEINIHNISKKYNHLLILENTNLKFYSNDFAIIYGKSGCGKTTFLNILSGFLKPDTGHISYSSLSLDKYKDELLSHHISYVFQDHRLLNELNVKDNILSGCIYHEDDIDNEWFDYLCHRLKIDHLYKRNINKISIGQRQRVAIARALIKKPEVLLLDEPTGNLDKENTLFLMNFLKELQQKQTMIIIMVTHEQYLKSYGNRILYFQDHQLIEEKQVVAHDQDSFSIQKKKRQSFFHVYWFLKRYLSYHFYYYLFLGFCIAICCFAFFLSLNVGSQFEDYIYNTALNQEFSKEISITPLKDNERILVSELDEIKQLPHVKNISYSLNHSYAFERSMENQMIITYHNQIVNEEKKLIDFFQFKQNVQIIEGNQDIHDNEIVIEESLAQALHIDNPIGKTITIRIPFVYYFQYENVYDQTDNQNQSYQYLKPVITNKEIKFVIKGIMKNEDNECYRIYHDASYLESLVKQYASKDISKDQVSAMSTSLASIEIDSIDHLKETMDNISTHYSIHCENRAYDIMTCLQNIESVESIYTLLSLFIIITLIGVIYSMMKLNFSQRQKYHSIIKVLGESDKEAYLFSIGESLLLIVFVFIFMILFSNVLIPIMNTIFSQNNSIVITTQFVISQEIQLFSMNTIQFLYSCFFGCVIIIIIQMTSWKKMKKISVIELLNWEVR